MGKCVIQDLPPEGGYKPITYKRVPAKSFFNGWGLVGTYVGVTIIAMYVYYLTCKAVLRNDLEERSARFALKPLLTAERDREYLKQMLRNREEERELMKNVKGWVVGTYYGEKLYKLPENETVQGSIHDYYVHAKNKYKIQRRDFAKWL